MQLNPLSMKNWGISDIVKEETIKLTNEIIKHLAKGFKQ